MIYLYTHIALVLVDGVAYGFQPLMIQFYEERGTRKGKI